MRLFSSRKITPDTQRAQVEAAIKARDLEIRTRERVTALLATALSATELVGEDPEKLLDTLRAMITSSRERQTDGRIH